MSKLYWRPIPQSGGTHAIAGTAARFSYVETLARDRAPQVVAADDIPAPDLMTLTQQRSDICALSMDRARIMGIVNATPDSFSDGGDAFGTAQAVDHAKQLARDGADIIDIGGESTRPGADVVGRGEEIDRTAPVIAALHADHFKQPLSIDTRNAAVAEAAIKAGAQLFNDVSAFSHDPDSMRVAANSNVAVCLMHASADPKTMQAKTTYDHVVLDIYDYLEERIETAVKGGIDRARLIADPGIGFGKTIDQNLALIRNLSVFHGLGVPLLLGASRKSFIGKLTGATAPKDRLGGSLAIAIEGARQGAQIMRVHDVAETAHALAMARALETSP